MDKACQICGALCEPDFDLCTVCEDGIQSLQSSPYLLMSAIKYILDLGIDDYSLTLHPTQSQSPEQCQEFIKILSNMWQTHLDKNADYSPANILLTGPTGVATRLWDKTARLLSLLGFRFKAILFEELVPPKEPKNESISDTYMDLAVYAIIGQLMLRGKWGK